MVTVKKVSMRLVTNYSYRMESITTTPFVYTYSERQSLVEPALVHRLASTAGISHKLKSSQEIRLILGIKRVFAVSG